MIRNEREYQQTRKILNDLDDDSFVEKIRAPSRVGAARLARNEATIADLRQQVRAYEQLKASGGRDFALMPLKDLGEMLVMSRIARGWLQQKLADELEVSVQTIEKYEKNDYGSASLLTLLDAARVLGLEVECQGSMAKLDAFPELPTAKKRAGAKR